MFPGCLNGCLCLSFFSNSYICVCFLIHHDKSSISAFVFKTEKFKCCNMWPTLDVFRCLLMANRPALRWAISSCSISSLFHLHVLTCTFDSIVVCTFSFGHCIVRLSSIYDFWLPLWYLQTLLIMPLYPFWCSFRTTNISIFWLVQFYICITLYVYLTLLFNHSQSFGVMTNINIIRYTPKGKVFFVIKFWRYRINK
jgi:hypothetical protein